jgi:serine O-acetyltransferase
VKLVDHSRESLLSYVVRQQAAVTPDGRDEAFRKACDACLDEALQRMNVCIDACSPWRPGEFDVLQSSQHTIFLYYLANTIWRRLGETAAPTRLFLMNKAFNSIDLFFAIEMPEVFYIGHSLGIVLARATYGNYLVLYQGVTVGRHKDQIPQIGDRVVLYPGSSVAAGAVVEDDVVLSQGVRVIGKRVPAGQMVFAGGTGELTFRPRPDDLLKEYFRL